MGIYCEVVYRLEGCVAKCTNFTVIAHGSYSYHQVLNVVRNYIHYKSRDCCMFNGRNV